MKTLELKIIQVPEKRFNTAERNRARVDFIRREFPTIGKVDPYFDRNFVDNVKEALFRAGFYTRRDQLGSASVDGAVIRAILKAQGKEVRTRAKRNFIDQREVEAAL